MFFQQNERGCRRFQYDVALSFASENRSYVEQVARILRNTGVRVFYDADPAGRTWGRPLANHLEKIYRDRAQYCVAFLSRHYVRKRWTMFEWANAIVRSMNQAEIYILPVRFDRTTLPGLPEDIVYVDGNTTNPTQLALRIAAELKQPDGEDDSPADLGRSRTRFAVRAGVAALILLLPLSAMLWSPFPGSLNIPFTATGESVPLTIHLNNSKGEPIGGGAILIHRAGVPYREYQTSAEGVVTCHVPPGDYSLVATVDNIPVTSEVVVSHPGADVRLTLPLRGL